MRVTFLINYNASTLLSSRLMTKTAHFLSFSKSRRANGLEWGKSSHRRRDAEVEAGRGNRKTGNSAREGGRIQKLFPAWFLFGDMGGFAADLGRFGETTLPLGFRWALLRLRLPLRSPWVGADRRDAPSFRRAGREQCKGQLSSLFIPLRGTARVNRVNC